MMLFNRGPLIIAVIVVLVAILIDLYMGKI